MTSDLSDLVGRLQGAGSIGADDVLALRAKVYGAPEVTEDEMAALVALDAACGERVPEWGDFYAEAMTDYVVHQQDPRDYVDAVKAHWVMTVMAAADRVDSGLEALTRILEAAEQVPPELESFVLQRVKAAIAAAGAISAAHVALLRRLVFAPGGGDNIGVTREEADALFDIDAACRAGANDAAWPDFFAKAVADCLTAVSPFHLETREQALSDEAWLAKRESTGEFLGAMLRAPKVWSALKEVFHPHAEMAAEWTAAEATMETAEADAAPVTEEEARWLAGRLAGGDLTAAERQLIDLLKAHASDVSDLLKPWFDAATSVTPARDWTAPTFGRRGAAAA